jgi:RHS repeat-associated protein
MKNRFAREEFGHWIEKTPYQTKADISFDHRPFKEMAYLMADDPVNVAENNVYFYHSDHLGSASWITDSAGIAVQHLQYLPYGEPYINQHPYGYSERFTFTGKERDEETGYGYFGARYMDHELMTGWLSVDPMAGKYPSISPYAYCAWNPVKLVDPDGREVYITGDEKSKEEALRQIQQKSKNMKFSIAENGKLTFEGKAKTKEEKYMKKIINSSKVIVDLCLLTSSDYNGVPLKTPGGFDGNTISDDGKTAYASQVINLVESDKWDKKCGNNLGNSIWHELSEAYEGGLISLKLKQDAPAAITGNDQTIYEQAHYNAGKYFPGTIGKKDVVFPKEVQYALKTLGILLGGKEFNTSFTKYEYTR